jgi:hypothetical protein
MDEHLADSALDAGAATGATVPSGTVADSTPTQQQGGQEQDDQKRINDLMALANKRLSERDQARAEIEALKAEMAGLAAEAADYAAETQPTQRDLMGLNPPPPEPSQDEVEYDDTPIVAGTSPMRPDVGAAMRSPVTPVPMSASARYLSDRNEIAQMKARLNELGAVPRS